MSGLRHEFIGISKFFFQFLALLELIQNALFCSRPNLVMNPLLLSFLLLLAVSSEAGKVLVYSPSISRSHLISNGRIADALVDAGHDVVMFITEYMPLTSFTGTKKAKVITMRGFSEFHVFSKKIIFYSGTRFSDEMEGADTYLLSTSRLGFLERLMFEKACTATCDGRHFGNV